MESWIGYEEEVRFASNQERRVEGTIATGVGNVRERIGKCLR